MKNYICAYKDQSGQTFIRCNDGKFRSRPWMGTFGDCISFHSLNGAKRIETNYMWLRKGTFKIILVDEPQIDCSEIWKKVEKHVAKLSL